VQLLRHPRRPLRRPPRELRRAARRRRRLRARLCRLDEENRDIVLRDFEGDTSEQIAAARGLSAATVRKRLERAYKKMAPN
jgi:DNA-directed RNA polymerase specialized sigma24 family protein